MDIVNITQARKDLYNLVDYVLESHKPVFIKAKNGSAVLLDADDWEAVQETLNLFAVPGVRKSISEGVNADVSELIPEEEV